MADSNLNIIIKLVDKASAGAKNLVKSLKDTEGAAGKSKSATEKLSDALKKASGDVGGMGSALGLLKGAFAGIGISMVIDKLIELGSASIDAASDVDEMRNKFDTVFGKSTRDAEKSLAKFGNEVGRSKYGLMEMAASLQDTFVPLGFTRVKAAELSTEMTELAVDVASFTNAADGDVMRDFQSAIVGNHETVRKYGIVITQAALDQELMNMGIQEGIKGATEEEKVQARLNMIIAGTADAHGDAARTSDSYANATRDLEDATKDFNVTLGEELLPTMAKLKKETAEVVKWYTSVIKFSSLLEEAKEKEAITYAEYLSLTLKVNYMQMDVAEGVEILTNALAAQDMQAGFTSESLYNYNNSLQETGEATQEATVDYAAQAEAEYQLTEAKNILNDAEKADIITKRQAIELNMKLKDGVIDLTDSEIQAIETKLAYHEAAQKTAERIDESRQAAADAAIAFYDMADSLRYASAVDVALATMDVLNGMLEDNNITTDQYNDAVKDLNDEFGLFSEKGLALAENIPLLGEALGNNQLPVENMGEALRSLYQDAGDGEVDLQNIIDKFGTAIPESTILAESSLSSLYDLGLVPVVEATSDLSDMQNTINEDRIPRQLEQLNTLLTDGLTPLFEAMDGSVIEGGAIYRFQRALIETGTMSDTAKSKINKLKSAIDELPTEKHIWIYVHTVHDDAREQFIRTHAHGNADYIVPPGYPNDSYNVGLSSGERVVVQTPAQQKSYNVTNNFRGGSETDIIGAMRRIEFLYG